MKSKKFVTVFVLCAVTLLAFMPACKSSEEEAQKRTATIEESSNQPPSDSDMFSVTNEGEITESDDTEQAPVLSEQDGFCTYMQGDWGWQIPVPLGWETQWQGDPTREHGALAVYDPNTRGADMMDIIGVRFTRRVGMTFEEILQWEMQEALVDVDYQTLLWEELKVNGRPSIKHIYTHTTIPPGPKFEPGQRFNSAGFYIWCGDFTMVTIGTVTKTERFDEILPLLERMVEGFLLVK